MENNYLINFLKSQKRKGFSIHLFFFFVLEFIFGIIFTILFQAFFGLYNGKQVIAGFGFSTLFILPSIVVSFKRFFKTPLIRFTEINFNLISGINSDKKELFIEEGFFSIKKEVISTTNGRRTIYKLTESKIVKKLIVNPGENFVVKINDLFFKAKERVDFPKIEFLGYKFYTKKSQLLYIVPLDDKIVIFINNKTYNILSPVYRYFYEKLLKKTL